MDKASLHPAEGFGTAPIKAEGMMVDYDSGLSWVGPHRGANGHTGYNDACLPGLVVTGLGDDMTDWEMFLGWLDENEWYAEEPEMREWVDDWADKRPNLPYSTKLKCAEQLAWQQFPEYFKEQSDSILPCGGRIGDCRCI